jgi:Eukaryotic aspartyl protease
MGAIADTGTTLILLDQASAEAYYLAVQGAVFSDEAQAFLVSCNTVLPDLDVEIEGTTFTVPGSLLNFAPAPPPFDSGSKYPLAPFLTIANPLKIACVGGIQITPKAPMIFGDIFFKAVFVAFDAGTPPRLGFAKQDLNAQGGPAQAPDTASPPSNGTIGDDTPSIVSSATPVPVTPTPKNPVRRTKKVAKTVTQIVTVPAAPSPTPQVSTMFITVTAPAT